METLQADKSELDTDTERRWCSKQRRKWGIAPNEAACWVVRYESHDLATDSYDHDDKWLFVSPADALSTAEICASNARRRLGTGTWILETYEDGISGPAMLFVVPIWDEQL